MLELWISVGKHRKERNWKNKKYTWPELVDRLSKCQFTGETVKEYAAMTPDEQAPIKDVGGFVGGTINGGRRKKGAITSRCLVTLDMDSPPVDFWDELMMFQNFTCLIYSTHKHTPVQPRCRLIIPLDREVFADEYEAIARKVADSIGMEYFDPTTFQPERLMYWPSMPKDGAYEFRVNDGELMSADSVLAQYKDWRDSSQWPMHETETHRVLEGVKLAADPLEKPGIVGAFCRVYDIESAIAEFLPDVYEPAGEGRYTFLGGSTAAGLVVYSDKWAYSHHGTDPCSGILCNAFDLVRIHKFGKLDERCKDDTPINKRPSFVAMGDLARTDGDVNLDLVKQQTTKAQGAFADELAIDAGAADEWLKTLETDRRGKIQATASNIMIIFRNDPGLKGKLRLNAFSSQYRVFGDLPWNSGLDGIDREWTDYDDAGLRWYIETTYRFTAVNKLYDGLAMIMQENAYHPVREYLEGLVWDGVERLSGLLIDYIGADDNEYVRAATYKTFIGAVARVMQPGIKFDTVLTLIGPQGSAKSQLIAVMGGQWYSENLGRLDTNQAMENIQGAWLVEIAEMAALKKAEVEVIKHFISKTEDAFRPAFGRRKQVFPRQNIFIGSANDDEFIKDQTGGRRFWPANVVKSLFYKNRVFNVLPKFRDQLWAEAVQGYLNDEPLHLPPDIEEIAEQVQAEHTEKDLWTGPIQRYLEILLPEKWDSMSLWDRRAYLAGDETQPAGNVPREKVTSFEIWVECLKGDEKGATGAIGRRIHFIMKKLGWELSTKMERLKAGSGYPNTPRNYYVKAKNEEDDSI